MEFLIMATYDYEYVTTYTGLDILGLVEISSGGSIDPASGVLATTGDGTPTTFDNGDEVNGENTNVLSTEEFVGTIEVDGVTYPVTQTSGPLGLGLAPVTRVYSSEEISIPDNTALNTDDPYVACFVQGTTISGLDHDIPVEDIQAGDMIVTSDHSPCRVLWVGTQTIDNRFGHAERLQPVRITANALGDNVPNKEMTLSSDHALLIDGVLVNAGALVNGTSIYRVPLSEFEGGKITYYHVETEAHEIILANNTPAETFIDNVSRSTFSNYQEYVDLYGEEREMDELKLPRAMSQRQLPRSIKAQVAERAEVLGFVSKAAA